MTKTITCGIYKITNPKGCIYIGQSIDCETRCRRYSRAKCQTQHRLYNSIIKYGWDSHTFEIIHPCAPSELNDLEIYYIKKYDCFDTEHGLNLIEGGRGMGGKMSEESRAKRALYRPSEETKRKMSEATKGEKNHNYKKPLTLAHKQALINSRKGKKHSPETIAKMSAARMGRGGWMHTDEFKSYLSKINKGRKMSDDAKMKISIAHKGRKMSESQKEILRKLGLGRKVTDETKSKISRKLKGRKIPEHQINLLRESRKGAGNPMYGRVVSLETRAKLSQSHKGHPPYGAKAIIQCDLNDIFIKEYPSIIMAAKGIGVAISNISSCLRGRNKTAAGFKWYYKDKSVISKEA